MAHKLAPSMRNVDRILKNRLLTGNFNLCVQAQPKSLDARQFLSQSSVYLSNKLKGSDKLFSSKEGNKGATNVGESRAAEQNIGMKGHNVSSTISPKSARKDLNHPDPQSPLLLSVRLGVGQGRRYITLKQALALGSSNDGGRGQEESSGGPRLEGKDRWPIWAAYTILGGVLGNLKKDYEVSNESLNEDLNADLNEDYKWKDFVDNFKGRGTVEKAEMKINNVATENTNGEVGINKKKYERFILGVMIPMFMSSVIDGYIDSHKYFDTSRKIIPAKALRLLRFCDALCIVWAAYYFTLIMRANESKVLKACASKAHTQD